MLTANYPTVSNLVTTLTSQFTTQPKFEDLADYLPFLCAYGQTEFARAHVLALRAELNSTGGLLVTDSGRLGLVRFQDQYEILLGLIETYRLTGDELYLKMALDLSEKSYRTFCWRKRMVMGYSRAFRFPIPVVSAYCYSIVELMLDLYEITADEKFLHRSSELLEDLFESPCFREHGVIPMGDYLVGRRFFYRIRPPRTCHIGKNTCALFGAMRYSSVSGNTNIRAKAERAIDSLYDNVVEDGIVFRLFNPQSGERSEPFLSAAFMMLHIFNFAYHDLQESRFLSRAVEIADRWIGMQSGLGLFPHSQEDRRTFIDSETDMAVSLLELAELSGKAHYRDAARRCFEGILAYNLAASSVDADTGEPKSPVYFRAKKPTPKFLALLLKLAYCFTSERPIYGRNGLASLIRDR